MRIHYHPLRTKLRSLGPVLGPALFAILNPHRVQSATYNMIPHARQILHAPTPDQNDCVFLQIVADTGNVCRYFDAIGKPYACHFTQSGIRLLRC